MGRMELKASEMGRICRGHMGCGRYWQATLTTGERFATITRQRDGGLINRPARHRYEVVSWHWSDPDAPQAVECLTAMEAKKAVREALGVITRTRCCASSRSPD